MAIETGPRASSTKDGKTRNCQTWNVRTLSGVGKLAELEYELERYKWYIISIAVKEVASMWRNDYRKRKQTLAEWKKLHELGT